MKTLITFWCLTFLLCTKVNAQNTLESGPDILTGDGSGIQNWGDNVTLEAFKIDGSPGMVKLDSRRKDQGFGVEGARWGQIDYYQDYQGQRVDASEKMVVDFNGPVINVVLRVGMLGINEGVGPVDETGKWTGYDQNGVEVASGIFGPEDSDLGPDVKLVPDSYGIFPFTLYSDIPFYSLSIEATAFDYGRGEPKYVRNYDNESGNTENNSDFNIGAITYTRSGAVPGSSSPIANNDAPGPVKEDIGPTIFSYDVFLANDTDADGDVLQIISFDFSNFPGVIEDRKVDREIWFTTAVNFNGEINVPYTISDGTTTDTGTITFTITEVPDDLHIGVDGPFVIDKNESLTIAANTLLANDTAITYLGSPVQIVLKSVENAINGSVVLEGENVVFTPTNNFVGQASFTYSVEVLNDGFGGSRPVDIGTSNPILITIEGNGNTPISINQKAVLVPKTNEAFTLQVNAKKNRTSAIVEACDEQGQVWTISDSGNGFHKIINDFAHKALEAWQPNPSNGDDVTIFSSNNKDWQQWKIIDAGNGYLKIKGKYNQRYLTLSNGNAVMLDENNQDDQLWKLLDPTIVSCDSTNNPPIAVDDGAISGDPNYTLILGETLVIPFSQLLVNDSDPDGDPLTITAVQPQRGGDVVIVEDTVEFKGTNAVPGALFTYTLSDGRGGTDTGSVLLNVLPSSQANTQSFAPSFYPTLVKDVLHILTDSNSDQRLLRLDVYNNFGSLVKKIPIENMKQQTLNLYDLQPGIYIIHLFTSKRSFIQKIIKQ